MIDVLVWWAVLGWAPTASGAALAIVALRGPYGYRGRHSRRGRETTLFIPEVLSEPDQVRSNRKRIEARASAAEVLRPEPELTPDEADEVDATLEWLVGLQPPAADFHPELHRYEHAAGSPAYAQPIRGQRPAVEPRDERVSTAEMYLRFGAELAPVVGPVAVADEWVST